MSALSPVELLLLQGEVAGLELDAAGAIAQVHNPSLLHSWISGDRASGSPALQRDALLEELFGPRNVRVILQVLEQLPAEPGARLDPGPLPARNARAGTPSRQFAVAVHRTADGGRLLVLQDVSRPLNQAQELQDMRLRYEAAMAVLRAPPDGLRLFLGSAMASVSAIRATLRMPARTRDAMREKLGRLRTEAASLAAEAEAIGLSPVVMNCQSLADAAAALQARDDVSGDDLLPLAPRIDAIASSIGSSSRIEEQRFEPPPASSEPARRTRRSAAWHEVSERRWSEFLRRRGEEIGTLARLTMTGAEQVPSFHRRHVDEILQHLLKNALDHGIETPEHRLAQGKSAAGRITISFARNDDAGLKMTVHDDGRGFDLERIGRAAVQSGLLNEESLQRREAGELVGLIFKPSFTTEGLQDGDGQGRGMSYLRRKVTRLGGQISVATKSGRYTLFTIELPASEVSDEPAGVSQAMP
jgi:signal transduction histidine kinase